MATKYFRSGEEVLKTIADSDKVPEGFIRVKLRPPAGQCYWVTMSLQEYNNRAVVMAPATPSEPV